MLKEILDSKYEPRISSGKFSISSIGKCRRAIYLTMKGLYKEEFSEDLLRTFKIGNVVHQETIRELITKSGSKNLHFVAGEIEIPIHPFLSGRLDAIISNGKENFICDFKSAGNWSLKKLALGEITEGYIDQVNLYMYLVGIHKSILLFVGKEKGEILEIPVIYDEDRAKRKVAEIQDFMENFVAKGIEPPKCTKEISHWGCKCCGV